MVLSARARAGFAAAIEGHPFLSVDDLEAQLASGCAFVWSGAQSDVFVRIENSVCEMGPVAGCVEEMLRDALPAIEEWARQNACSQMHVQAGRQGWARALAPYGYEPQAIILGKKLSNGS